MVGRHKREEKLSLGSEHGEAALQHYLQHLQTAVQRRGASNLQHYFDCVRP